MEDVCGDYCLEITKNVTIDAAEYPRNYMAMINDSKGSKFNNNCKFVVNKKDFLASIVSTRDIKNGEELFIDYGPVYW